MACVILLLPPDPLDIRLATNELGEPLVFDTPETALAWRREHPDYSMDDPWQLIDINPTDPETAS